MLRLELEGRAPFDLDNPTSGIIVQEWDLTFPEVRAVSQSRPSADGTINETAHFGARALTLKAHLNSTEGYQTRQSTVDRLRSFCHPASRPWFYFIEEEGQGERRIQLVADQQSSPISSPASREISVSWRCPDPFVESSTERVVDVTPPVFAPGVGFPLTFDVTFPLNAHIVNIRNHGTMPTTWIARIHGPCVGPKLVHGNTGGQVDLPTLTVDAGTYVELNSRTYTVRVNGEPSASRYHLLDFDTLTWFTLDPGINPVYFLPVSASPPSKVELEFRDRWL